MGAYARIWWLDAAGGLILSLVVIISWSITSLHHMRNLTGFSAQPDERNLRKPLLPPPILSRRRSSTVLEEVRAMANINWRSVVPHHAVLDCYQADPESEGVPCRGQVIRRGTRRPPPISLWVGLTAYTTGGHHPGGAHASQGQP